MPATAFIPSCLVIVTGTLVFPPISRMPAIRRRLAHSKLCTIHSSKILIKELKLCGQEKQHQLLRFCLRQWQTLDQTDDGGLHGSAVQCCPENPVLLNLHSVSPPQDSGQLVDATPGICRKSKKPKNDLIAKSWACDKVSVRAWHQREMPPRGVWGEVLGFEWDICGSYE